MKTQKWGIFAYLTKRDEGWSWYLKGTFEDYDHAMLYALRTSNSRESNFAIMLLNERGERLIDKRGTIYKDEPVKWLYYEPREPEFDGNPLLYGTFTHGTLQNPLTERTHPDLSNEWRCPELFGNIDPRFT